MQTSNDFDVHLKSLLIDLLKELIRVCEQLNLRYYVIGGTLLGAVRHQGFIPWDDDIDVGMPRKDYEILIQKAQSLLPPHVFLQTFETDPEYPANFAKFRNSNTTFIETSVSKYRINHGVYLDVFPLDAYPSDRPRQLIFKFKQRLYAAKIGSSFYLPKEKMAKQLLRRLVGSFVFGSVHDAVKKRDRLYRSVKDPAFLVNLSGVARDREIIPAEWYGKGCDLPFEGLTVKVPEQYDKWLTHVYGDYMTPPPEEKRVTHHYTEIIDLDTPYTAYMKKFLR